MNRTDSSSDCRPLDLGIVVPLFNKEATVRSSIEALLSQTEPPRRIVVVDDGSTDGGLRAIAPFSDRITILKQSNAGPSSARNRGIEELDTEWVGFADADNRWHADRVRTVRRMIQSHPNSQWLTGRYCRYEADGSSAFVPPMEQSWSAGGRVVDYFRWMATGVYGVHASETLVARRRLLIDTGGFHPKLRCHEITLMYLSLAVASPLVGVVGPPTVDIFCDRPDSLFSSLEDSPVAMLSFGKGLLELAQRAGCHQQEIRQKAAQAVQTAFWLALNQRMLPVSREIILNFSHLLGWTIRFKGHIKLAYQSLLHFAYECL